MAVKNRISRVLNSAITRWLLGIIVLLAVGLFTGYRYWLVPKINKDIGDVYFKETGHHLTYKPLQISLRQCQVSLNNIQDEKKLFSVEHLFIDVDCKKTFSQREIVVRQVQLDGVQVSVKQTETGWSFDDVLAHQKKQNKSVEPSTTKAVIQSLLLNRVQVSYQTSLFPETFAVNIPSIQLGQFNSNLSAPLNTKIQGNLNQQAHFTAHLNIDLKTLSGSIQTELSAVPFKWFESQIKNYLLADVIQGELQVNETTTLLKGAVTKIVSSGSLSNVILRPTLTNQDAVKWNKLQWKAAELNLLDQRLQIPELMLSGLDGQFIIDQNRKTNLQALIKPASTVGQSQEKPAEKPWSFSVDRLKLDNAAIGFFDQSLVPSFNVIVQNFSGEITSISNDPDVETIAKLKGNVDGYSPVSLTAKGKLFLPTPQLNAQFNLKDLDMGALSPYSAEYAGWKIKKGHLSVDLDYRYDQGKILGKNHVVISHLAFGEKVRSPNAIDLPLRMGLSLLTDENGVAVLDTEITGDPKNPQFNIKEIVIRALKNTFKKIITSPFRFLASLVNTEQDLGEIAFTYGESQLTPESQQKLELIKLALDKRPKLFLTVKPNVAIVEDTKALQEEQVKTLLKNAGASAEEQRDHTGKWPALVMSLAKQYQLDLSQQDASLVYQQLIALESVNQERLIRLAHERGQAIKQYFVLTKNVPSERILLDGQLSCGDEKNCRYAKAEFVLDDE